MAVGERSDREIPREEWVRFLDGFSREHAGWMVDVRVLGARLGDQVESERLPLVGITADKGGRARIDVIVGRPPDADLDHAIQDVQRLAVKPRDPGGHEAIEVVADDGTVTLVTFHAVPAGEAARLLPAGG
jgi:hypothetical protein